MAGLAPYGAFEYREIVPSRFGTNVNNAECGKIMKLRYIPYIGSDFKILLLFFLQHCTSINYDTSIRYSKSNDYYRLNRA